MAPPVKKRAKANVLAALDAVALQSDDDPESSNSSQSSQASHVDGTGEAQQPTEDSDDETEPSPQMPSPPQTAVKKRKRKGKEGAQPFLSLSLVVVASLLRQLSPPKAQRTSPTFLHYSLKLK